MNKYLESHPNKNDRTASLWLSEFNRGFSKAGIHRIIKLIAKRSKIQKRVTAHIYRHSRLTELAGLNYGESNMRYFAGWSKDSTMPAIYLHASGDGVLKALRLVEPKNFVSQASIEQQVSQRVEKMRDEIYKQVMEALKHKNSEFQSAVVFTDGSTEL